MFENVIWIGLALFPFFSNPAIEPVNRTIGDKSYQVTFGELPTADTSYQFRIYTHLSYVEKQLRASSIRYPDPIRKRRINLLHHLKNYRIKANYPHNHTLKQQPVFKDHLGNLCAVGYLIYKTKGMDLVNTINNPYQYSNLTEMTTIEELRNWVKWSGFTIHELMMIQPSYGSVFRYKDSAPIPTPTPLPVANDEINDTKIISSEPIDSNTNVTIPITFKSNPEVISTSTPTPIPTTQPEVTSNSVQESPIQKTSPNSQNGFGCTSPTQPSTPQNNGTGDGIIALIGLVCFRKLKKHG